MATSLLHVGMDTLVPHCSLSRHNLSNSMFALASFPGLPRFYLSFNCVHNNTREWKTGEKRVRPGSIGHVSGREVDMGGEGPIFKYIRTKLESEFLTGQDE